MLDHCVHVPVCFIERRRFAYFGENYVGIREIATCFKAFKACCGGR